MGTAFFKNPTIYLLSKKEKANICKALENGFCKLGLLTRYFALFDVFVSGPRMSA